jgi:hypothetical protein
MDQVPAISEAITGGRWQLAMLFVLAQTGTE